MADMLTDNLDGSEPWHNGAPYVPTTIGHVPKCTQKAREFLKGFPAEERAAALRPFMIRYKLFPDNCKDVHTAPITIKELKGLSEGLEAPQPEGLLERPHDARPDRAGTL